MDAAVAISACLAVVYPHMTGLGGDAFWLICPNGEDGVQAYNGSGRAGYKADRAAYAGETSIPVRGPRSAVTVPGMVDSWAAVLKAYGRLQLADVLEPAIGYAAEGFPLSPDQYRNTVRCETVLRGMPETASIYLPGGKIPAAGRRFKQAALAASLRLIAAGGRDILYRGELAAAITDDLARAGGMLTADDFADHAGEWVEPVRGTYRGLELFQTPPNSQGFTGIMAAHMLETFDFSEVAHGSYEYTHLLIEALKLAFRDRNRELTDPKFHDVPVPRLIDKAYCAELAARIDMSRTMDLEAPPQGSDTAYAAVIDGEGNAVSFIQSLYYEFGSAVAAGGTGILLQNRGSFFSLDPRHVNRLEPRKRTFHTLMPAMALREGRPYLLYGTQGGEGQPQTQTALLTRMVDYGMDPQEAVNAPRWVWGRTWGEATQELKMERRIAPEVRLALAEAGHTVKVLPDFDGTVGHAHVIKREEDGLLSGGTDPRCDGAAIGW